MAETDPFHIFVEARDRFLRTALLLSGLSLLAAAASRLPTWEAKAPVEWLAGSVNVGFIPIFAPILIVFGYAYLYLVWLSMLRAAEDLPIHERAAGGPLGYEFARMGSSPSRRAAAAALVVLHLWCVAPPVAAYIALLTTYADFCAPGAGPEQQAALCTGTQRALTLLVGTQGVAGFKPQMASIQANLRSRALDVKDADERARLLQIADRVPWIYPPLQTWLYLGGLGFLTLLAKDMLSGGSAGRRRRSSRQ
jgi:hypothetical protein